MTITGSLISGDTGKAYAAASDVAALCRNLLGSASTFLTTTSPTLASVNTWLSSGCSVIESYLSARGYSTPVAVGTVARAMVTDLNTLYAAARAEMSRANVVLGPGERTRGQVFDEMFRRQLTELLTMDLTIAGIARSNAGILFVGGISKDDKDSYEDDTDRVAPRFKRNMHRFPGVIDPYVSTDE
jgi:hypothetical protein